MKKTIHYLWKTSTGNILLIGIAFLAFAIALQLSSYQIISRISFRVVNEINSADSIGNKSVVHLTYQHAPAQMQYIKEQFLLASQLKTVFKEMTLEYFRNYYAFSVCFTIFMTMLIIAGFLVAHQGWANCPIKTKTFFVFSALFASFYYFMPKVMNNSANITKAIQQQKAYEGIQLDILTFGTTADTADTHKMDSMIAVTDRAIKMNYTFAISIDPSQVGMTPGAILTGSSDNSQADNTPKEYGNEKHDKQKNGKAENRKE